MGRKWLTRNKRGKGNKIKKRIMEGRRVHGRKKRQKGRKGRIGL